MYSRPSRFINEIPVNLIKTEESKKQPVNDNYSFIPSFSVNASSYVVKTEVKAFELTYGEGDRVNHKKFGDGTVTGILKLGADYKVTIRFDSGEEKNLMATFAKLTKI